MPRRDTEIAAVRRYLAPFQDALGCITAGRVAVPARRRYVLGQVYSALLNRGSSIPLACTPVVHIVVGHRFRITHDDTEPGLLRASTVEYWYRFETPEEAELITFHWTPEEPAEAQTTRPHLHVGNRLLSDTAPEAIPNTYRLHVPTGRVSIEAVVRFAIEDLGCAPSRNDWRSVLDRGEARFNASRHPNV